MIIQLGYFITLHTAGHSNTAGAVFISQQTQHHRSRGAIKISLTPDAGRIPNKTFDIPGV